MNFFESFKVAINAIWVNKMRSLLTMLGIIIGISSVIAVVALGQGSKNLIGKEFEQFGVSRVYIGLNWREDPIRRDYFNYGDLDAITRAFEDKIVAASPKLDDSGKIVLKKESLNVYISGVNETYNKIEKLDMVAGRYLIDSDIKAKREVAVIDESAALKIFGRTNVLGEKFLVKTNAKSISFVVVGIYETPKSIFSNMGDFEQPINIYAPISTVEKMLGIVDTIYGIEVNLDKDADAKGTVDQIINLIERRHDNVGEEKYRGFTAEGEMEVVNKIMSIMTAVVGAIAAISLFVGGIGVMNIMLVSVTERTREIGIRKAIGARHRDILLQFLVEAVIISGIGGVIGTLLGIGFSFLISIFIKVPPSVSPSTILIAWAFSAGVGIFFGIYPANKAAKLDPIEALRYE
ncbi:MAG: ABC transporter permease [Bacillota bacterium]